MRVITGPLPRVASKGYEVTAEMLRRRGSTSTAVSERTVKIVTASLGVLIAVAVLTRSVQDLREVWQDRPQG